jgi:adenylylsulfate kinase
MTTGTVAWITGLPSAGKSTFAERAYARLRDGGTAVCLLDGDAVRACLVPGVGYAPADRAHFYETLGNLAALLARQGLSVLVAATAHRREFRDRARALAPAFLEVFVATPLDECKLRDPKGLYAAARDGTVHDVPGVTEPYEPPLQPAVIARDGHDDAALAQLVSRLTRDPATTTQRSPRLKPG